jgi:membrane-bound lytic murein transglycosylase MltF
MVGAVFSVFASRGRTSAEDTALPPPTLTPEEDASLNRFALPTPADWTGDFDGMKKRRLIRILVVPSKTLYFHDRGLERGFDAEFARAFAAELNKKVKSKSLKMRIMLIPVQRDRLLPALNEGEGDIAAGALTITPDRKALVDFTSPIAVGVREVVVTGPASPVLATIDDLAGKTIPLRKSSSYYEHVQALSDKLVDAGKRAIEIRPIEEDVEDEGILEMVDAGLLPMAVVDRYKGVFWSQILKDIKVREDLAVNEGGTIAWAVRKNSPLLQAEIASFMKTHNLGTAFGNTILARYAKSTKALKHAYSPEAIAKFKVLIGVFRKYARQYDFDYLMMVAQGFQESQLNQQLTSPRGAVGVMQMLPSTAADPTIGIKGIDKNAEKNIQAGIKYMSVLRDKYLSDPGLDQKNRTLLTFAAYNAGPTNLKKFRRLAEKDGLNPNVWFNNVELSAAKIVGAETVEYVSNIYKYYVAYKLIETYGGP